MSSWSPVHPTFTANNDVIPMVGVGMQLVRVINDQKPTLLSSIGGVAIILCFRV